MMRRRWIRAEWPFPIEEVARRIKNNAFSDDVQKGFIVDRVRKNLIEARYFERIQVVERVVDPFGRESIVDRIQYSQISFLAFDGPIGLEIVGASRDIRKFANSLAGICDYKLTLSNINVEPLKWAYELNKCSEKYYFTESIQVVEMLIAPEIRAKLVLSGSVDVSDAAIQFIGAREHKIEKVKLHVKTKPRSNIILANNAAATLAGDEGADLTSALRTSLFRLVQHATLYDFG